MNLVLGFSFLVFMAVLRIVPAFKSPIHEIFDYGDYFQSQERSCIYDHKSYTSGETIGTICLEIKCTDGNWVYTGQPSTCKDCQVWGDPQFLQFSGHYFAHQSLGSHVLTQFGSKTDPDYFVGSIFEEQPHWPGYTAPRDVQYVEPGGIVTVQLPAFDSDCFTIPPPSDCKLKVYYNRVEKPIGTEVSIFNSDDGEVLIFEHEFRGSTSRCIYIVGSKGFSVMICMSNNFYNAFIYVWAMSGLTDQLYGLCGALQDDFKNPRYTVPNGTLENDIKDFAQSWQNCSMGDANCLREQKSKAKGKKKKHYFKRNRCSDESLLEEIKEQCAVLAIGPCANIPEHKCAAYISACEYDLCLVSNPDAYVEGYVDHLLIESYFNEKL